ncbi:hypothetical protein OGV25_16740 [Pseudomonas sp. P1B16]|jgi:hypothetical protein|uniref:Uncharacterized protein n=1 Tax=Pseudomonas capeferrum TaxID=1495066 RepID=A0ABY7R402_9PSED|nr:MULTISPECIES: hypothetical protein [Pseudomonas]KEY89327.1 hypothetical protein PC358_09320 [Pseudomonas capeferrum]KGI95331.1 hypothetical protein MD26_00935 [Pseudomonas sp. H2]MBC3480438.1 hypothetical protein [Pseudomonas sp. SWRI77]MBC3501895.1 hypothetical protein [Pseudomonas sp. SWRI59]MBC3505976.1 hypothetical protein [Pseudomonas sp. SWRI68]
MRDAQPPVVLFRRLESNARQQLLHELEARVSEDGRDLIISRYRERSGEAAAQQRHEVHRRVPIATLLKWMAREGAEGEPC